MSNADVKKLLRKGKLSGKEAALLIIQSTWEEETTGQGFLSDTDIETIRSKLAQAQWETFNGYLNLYDTAKYVAIDAGRIGLLIASVSHSITPEIASYWSERRLREARNRIPKIVTAKEYEERKLAQRADKLLQPLSLGYVLSTYLPQDKLASQELIQEVTAFIEKERPEDDGYNYASLENGLWEYTDYTGLLSYILGEGKEPELARPWLEWLLDMLRGGRFEPVHYTEEASTRAHGYLEANAEYASIYEEQSKRAGAKDTAALIEAIEQYLAGELEPDKLDDRLWDTFVTGLELYEAGLAKYREYIDDYIPMLPEWPAMAILQDTEEPEAGFLIDRDTGLYDRETENMMLGSVSLYDSFVKGHGHEYGLEAYLEATRESIIQHARALLAFERAIHVIGRLLRIELITDTWEQGVSLGYQAINRLNNIIHLAKLSNPMLAPEPRLPIDEIDISSLELDERAVQVIESRLGKLLPKNWTRPVKPEPEEASHEPA